MRLLNDEGAPQCGWCGSAADYSVWSTGCPERHVGDSCGDCLESAKCGENVGRVARMPRVLRKGLIAHVREQIAAGGYETQGKLEVVASRLVETLRENAGRSTAQGDE